MSNDMIDQFGDRLLDAVVRQFFENPPVFGTLSDGTPVNIPTRSTPVQLVAARLLQEKNGELIDAILEAVDTDDLADLVAKKLYELIQPRERSHWTSDPNEKRRATLQEKVDARLVELIAQDTYAKMKSQED